MKGLLEGCILKLIEREESYGYKICEDLLKEGYKKINEGTIYPILIRLEKKKLINSTRRSSPLGPARKYFNITESGREYLKAFEYEWNEIKKIVDKFVGER